jgi:hypothetical protein
MADLNNINDYLGYTGEDLEVSEWTAEDEEADRDLVVIYEED